MESKLVVCSNGVRVRVCCSFFELIFGKACPDRVDATDEQFTGAIDSAFHFMKGWKRAHSDGCPGVGNFAPLSFDSIP